jgi:transcriptional regulator with XRE-family HTH domain
LAGVLAKWLLNLLGGGEVEIKDDRSISSSVTRKNTQDVCFCDSAGNRVAPMEDAAELRDKRGKGQEYVAKRIGVSVSMISQYERAKATPSLWHFELYAAALRVSLRRLMSALKETKRRAEAAELAATAAVTNLQAERERRQKSN